jgi:hypothetical protein
MCVGQAGADSAAALGAPDEPAWAIWLTGSLTGWLTGARGAAGVPGADDATRVLGAPGEAGTAAIFCAETTPKAARPRIINAATMMMTKRIIIL